MVARRFYEECFTGASLKDDGYFLFVIRVKKGRNKRIMTIEIITLKHPEILGVW